MSSGGGTMAAAPLPITPTPKSASSGSSASTAPPRRRPVTENWDDDFEFSIPVRSSKSTSRSSPVATPKRDSAPLVGEGRANGGAVKDSPDSFDEDWDEPLSGPSRSVPVHSPLRAAVAPHRASVSAASPARLHPPRSSQSHSPTLPSPTTPSASSWKTLGFPSSSSSTSLATARPGDTTPRQSLSKRSSTSFVSVRQGDGSPLSAHKHSPTTRNSPSNADRRSLHGSVSMTSLRRSPASALALTVETDSPRGPSPTRRHHSPAKSVPSAVTISSPVRVKGFPSPARAASTSSPARATSTSSPARQPSPAQSPQNLKSTPSSDNLREKRPSFWKRFSSGSSPSTSKESSPDKSPGQKLRKRASSVGLSLSQPRMPGTDEAIPPLPPLPASLRSPSGTMSPSPSRLPSGTSVHSGSGKSKRLTAAFLMRRSSSNMSYAVESPSKPGAVQHPYTMMKAGSASSINVPSPARSMSSAMASPDHTPAHSHISIERFSAASPSGLPSPSRTGEPGSTTSRKASGQRPRTFSPGFHLPSPSPGSPYSQLSSPGHAQSESEAEDHAPKSRQRVRPASAMPIPRRKEGSLTSTNQSNTDDHSFDLSISSTTESELPRHSDSERPRTVHMPTLEALSKGSLSARQPSTGSQHLSSSPTSTARSVTSQHSVLSSSAHSSITAHTVSTLRRLTSFSSKHRRRLSGGWKFGTSSSSSSTEQPARPTSQHLATVEGSPSKPSPVNHPGNDSPKPTSAFPGDSGLELGSPPRSNPRRLHQKSMASLQVMPQHRSDSPSHDWDDTTKSRVQRERRRLSFNDFVIPDQVLAKQKELKRGIGAVKRFAGGVQSLKALVAAHDTVCDNVLATGTQDDMKLFVTLENEYTQWWEMATVLIEVGSTGTEDSSAAPVTGPQPIRTRRITLATDDARATGEALNSMANRGPSYATVKSIFADDGHDIFGSDFGHCDPPQSDPDRTSTGKHDLSKRQLEVLRTMLRTPVTASDSVVPTVDQRQALKARMRQSMPVPPTNIREILPSGPATVRATNGPLKQTPVNTPQPLPIVSPEPTYIVPSPSYPSPETASHLAQPKTKGGLAGLRDFLRSLRANSGTNTHRSKASSKSSTSTATSTMSGESPSDTPKARPVSQQARRRPAPINTEAAEKWGHSPPASPLPSAGANEPMVYASTRASEMGSFKAPLKLENKKRRPSLKTIFRPSSGNWHELVRPTPPGSPLPTIPSQGTPDEPKTSVDGSSISSTPSRTRPGTLARPPSIPAFARLKLTKPYGSISVDTPNGSPTKPKHRPSIGQLDAPPVLISMHSAPTVPTMSTVSSLASVPQLPTPATATGVGPGGSGTQTPPDGEATLRLKSRVLGLGHPSESSPSRASSSPARTAPATGELQVPDDMNMPRSRSDGGAPTDADPVIALTPENLPVLLDYVKQCEKKLQEWRSRAVSLEKNQGLVLTTTKDMQMLPPAGRAEKERRGTLKGKGKEREREREREKAEDKGETEKEKTEKEKEQAQTCGRRYP